MAFPNGKSAFPERSERGDGVILAGQDEKTRRGVDNSVQRDPIFNTEPKTCACRGTVLDRENGQPGRQRSAQINRPAGDQRRAGLPDPAPQLRRAVIPAVGMAQLIVGAGFLQLIPARAVRCGGVLGPVGIKGLHRIAEYPRARPGRLQCHD